MVMTSWGFETGSPGTTLTGTLADADNVILTGGSTAVLSATQEAHGAQSAFMEGVLTSGTCYITKAITSDNMGAHVYLYLTEAPNVSPVAATEAQVIWFGVSSTRSAALAITSARELRIRDATSGGGTNVYTSTTALALNTWYRISFWASPGTTTANGSMRCAAYLLDSTTAVSGTSSGAVAGNAGVVAYNNLRIGPKCSTTAVAIAGYWDDWAYDEAAAGLLPPFGSTPPAGTVDMLDGYYAIDATDISSTPGPTNITISPSTGVFEPVNGFFVVPQSSSSTTLYTITATDAVSGASATFPALVPQAGGDVVGVTKQVIWNSAEWV